MSLGSPENAKGQLAHKRLTVGSAIARYLIQFAVIIASIAPIIIAFPFFQDKMEKGVIQGGVKG